MGIFKAFITATGFYFDLFFVFLFSNFFSFIGQGNSAEIFTIFYLLLDADKFRSFYLMFKFLSLPFKEKFILFRISQIGLSFLGLRSPFRQCK